jgi:hypothetical protein
MIKKNSATFILVSSVILAGCSLLPAQNQTINDQAKQAEKLAKIMEKGGQAICSIKKVGTEESYTITVKGKNMKVSGIDMGEKSKKGFMITDTLYTYVWEDGSKEGFKTKLPSDEEMKKNSEKYNPGNDSYQPAAVAKEYEDETKYNVNCKEGGVSDSEFVPPADVKFLDPAALMPSIPSSPKLPNIPNIPNIPSIPDSE